MLSLLFLALDSRRLDRRLDKDALTSARRADVSLLASPRTRAGATVEIPGTEAAGSLPGAGLPRHPSPLN